MPHPTEIQTLDVECDPRYGVWRITYSGRIYGDDRGYPSREAAILEAARRIAKDQQDAHRFARPSCLRWA